MERYDENRVDRNRDSEPGYWTHKLSLTNRAYESSENQNMQHKPFGVYERFIKRPLGLFLSLFALILLSPVLMILAVIVRAKLGSPVLFVQERPGRNNKTFRLYKFRSMTSETDREGNLLPDAERLPEFGKRLRATSLDELPELMNILKGDMSFVGPRPLLVRYLDRYSPFQARRHEVRPGITGLAQISGRNAIGWEDKFRLDIQYVDRITFLGDLKIIVHTFVTVLKHEGISAAGEATIGEFMGSNDG